MILYYKADDKGKLPKMKRDMLAQWLWEHRGKMMVLESKEVTKPTQKQFGFLYGGLYPMIAQLEAQQGTYWTIDDIDHEMKMLFWSEEKARLGTGEVYRRPITKSRMNKAELAIFITQVTQFIESHYGVLVEPATKDEWEFDVKQLELQHG